jgi:Flp pilus assembly protein CpaB
MKQKNLILMVVAVGCGLVAAFLTTQINAKGPKSDEVEVLVAAKDLAVGTLMSKADISKLTVRKKVAKDSLPTTFVVDESELLEKRLSAPVLADQTFNPSALSNRGVIILPEGMVMVSFPISPGHAAAGFIGPGSKVDVLAVLKIRNTLNAFPLLVDMHILAVDQHTSYDTKGGTFPNMSSVSLAVTQEQAMLLQMAKQRGCNLELLLRHPNKPLDPKYDLKRVMKLLQDDSPGGIMPSEGRGDGITPETVPPPVTVPPVQGEVTVSPPAAPKAEMVKVLKATADIAANTEITKDLIAQSFTEKEIPKETFEVLQAYPDLTPYLGQVFKTGIVKEQLVIKGMIGPATSKAAPRDPFSDPKEPKPEPPVEPKPKPVVVAKRTHDVAFHTASGTMIHRYEEFKPGEWRLKYVLSPEEAARDPKQPAAPDAPATPATPDKSPETGARKVD